MNSYNPANDHQQQYRARAERPVRPAPIRTVSSESLFRGDHEITIDHYGAAYRLKITRQGKLILNK